jgi:hypothetical protein
MESAQLRVGEGSSQCLRGEATPEKGVEITIKVCSMLGARSLTSHTWAKKISF